VSRLAFEKFCAYEGRSDTIRNSVFIQKIGTKLFKRQKPISVSNKINGIITWVYSDSDSFSILFLLDKV
jgi:hypothetical protein